MSKIFIFIFILHTSILGVDFTSQNNTIYQECKQISNTPKIIGDFGLKSMGGSTGTYTSLIILTLQDINLQNKKNPTGEISIYQICKKFLQQIKNKKRHNYTLILNDTIKQANNDGYLIVFTTLQELMNSKQ